ncbi:MAG: ethanolamine ammonia-lyase subunit EutC [Bacteroidota bacterium]
MKIIKSESSLPERDHLKQYTSARISLRTSGISLCTEELLSFKLAHAKAVDAVWSEWNQTKTKELFSKKNIQSLLIESEATSRSHYVQNPQSGSKLNEKSIHEIKKNVKENSISILLADGLSPKAIEEQGQALTLEIINEIRNYFPTIAINPIFLCKNGRVAIGDHIGELSKSKLVIVIIGERPGLTAPQSIGIYSTLHPTLASTNAQRNCISNIHAGGLSILQAAAECRALAEKMFQYNTSGYLLSEENK